MTHSNRRADPIRKRLGGNLRLVTLLAVLLLTAAACGQKSGVALSAEGGDVDLGGGQTPRGGAGGTPATTGTTPPAAGQGSAPGGAPGQPATTGGGASGTPGPAPSGGGGSTATDGSESPSGGAPPAGPNDKVGVSEGEIVIGVHAPVTGAAPFPQSSFEEGRDLYWRWLADNGGGVHGRNVRVVFRDDQYNPSRAVQVCREMVEKEKAFLLVGGGGADQITACAKYANQVGVPYLSAGVNEDGISNLKTYFAMSVSYAQQSTMIAQLAKNKLGMTKLGIVVADTPSFADAHASFTQAAEAQGLEIVRNSKINKNASTSETLSEAGAQQQAGAEVIYFLSSPAVFIQFAQQANSQGYTPQYVGPGITGGLNTVARVGCPGIGQARFLSPFFGLEDPGAATYKQAYRDYNGSAGDDIGLALWGLNAALHKMFEAVGRDLGRAAFIATLESGQSFDGGVFPPVSYSAGNHLGGRAAHLLRADCGQGVYVTEAKNVTAF